MPGMDDKQRELVREFVRDVKDEIQAACVRDAMNGHVLQPTDFVMENVDYTTLSKDRAKYLCQEYHVKKVWWFKYHLQMEQEAQNNLDLQ